MGTRGTLRVYLNNELKVRQYNQWDSYPTGQFMGICQFFGTEWLVEELVEKLKRTRFYTKEEYNRAWMLLEGRIPSEDNNYRCDDRVLASNVFMLRNRDYGSNILLQIVCLCRNIHDNLNTTYAIVDWADAFEGDSIDSEEGNYVIHIETYPVHNPDNESVPIEEGIRFKLSGDWHGAEREFDWNYIPTDEEIEAWENEG